MIYIGISAYYHWRGCQGRTNGYIFIYW